jgi:hypothetical protein
VAEQFLDRAEVGAAVEQVCGEAMAEAMGSHLDVDAGLFQMFCYDARYAPRGYPLTAVVQENWRFPPGAQPPFLALLLTTLTQRL